MSLPRPLRIALLLFVSTQCDAYNQGSYLIFDLRSDPEAPQLVGRIKVDAATFTHSKPAPKADTSAAQISSEFEIDYSTFGSETESAFDSSRFNSSAFSLDATEETSAQPKNGHSLSE